ncbi:DUF4922 domain-containing protein [Massilibacteroides sp.]|uniref:DUF4922 domain-containing protein n=1 Tax=Massilibacteroides sp. TaxID=2034766 RepID=UPI00262A539F|nr:DUF4922 domain-containing protein [Massilibacteroides sp.]MDD4514155.1 DUF4922 domain-containing protein [Massilibacteroides sp.]
MRETIKYLFDSQFRDWEMAAKNYAALKDVREKAFTVSDCTVRVQFNPARILSSAAKVDAKSIQERACFLCATNRPAEQEGISFLAKYTILINPFPIFPRHLTIPSVLHTPQRIEGRMTDMLELAEALDEYVIFYNGPRCGASAPDHMHFQAGNKGFLPIENNWQQNCSLLSETKRGLIWKISDNLRTGWIMEGTDKQDLSILFDTIYKRLDEIPTEDEPMMNLLAWFDKGKWIVVVLPRKKHRPDCFFTEGEEQLTISPASVDLGGVFITPLEKDFDKITGQIIAGILHEVCLDEAHIKNISNRIKELL